ncbi:conserved hypothetical protein [Histoplasma capsulatum H143]|nr:conserved hypothetical protein [Histoplasma capsulatum H143]
MAADGAKAVDTIFPQPIPEHPVTSPAATTEHLKSPYKISAKIPNAKQPQRTTITTFTTPKESQCNPIFESTKSPNLLPAIQSLDWSANGDSYRQRLEALKHEVGTNWLTVLGDESWDTSQKDINSHTVVGSEYSPVGPLRPSLIARTSSQAIATGGRTVG